jgi:hypothetical protein
VVVSTTAAAADTVRTPAHAASKDVAIGTLLLLLVDVVAEAAAACCVCDWAVVATDLHRNNGDGDLVIATRRSWCERRRLVRENMLLSWLRWRREREL